MNLSERIKALWDNRNLVALKNTPYLGMVGVFLLSIFLIAFPHYVGLSQGVSRIEQLQHIETAFQTLYDERIPCEVNLQAQLVCDEPSPITVAGQYELIWENDVDVSTTTVSTIYFGSSRLVAIYVEEDTAYILEGDYRLLIGFDFRVVNDNVEGDVVNHQNEVTDGFLTAIYYSTTDEKLITIFISQFFQTLIFVTVLTIVTLLLNLDLTRKKMTLKEANTIMIAGMVGPALATAVLGLIYPSLGTIAFPFVYGFRMMIVYYYLRKNREKIVITK